MSEPKLVTIKQGQEEVPAEVLAENIVRIADGIRRLRSGRLNDKALYLLIQHAAPTLGAKYTTTRVSLAEIKAVFEGIEALERTYLKKKAQA